MTVYQLPTEQFRQEGETSWYEGSVSCCLSLAFPSSNQGHFGRVTFQVIGNHWQMKMSECIHQAF